MTTREMTKDDEINLRRRDVAELATSLLDILGESGDTVAQDLRAVLKQGQEQTSDGGSSSALAFGNALLALVSALPIDLQVRTGRAYGADLVRCLTAEESLIVEKGRPSNRLPMSCGWYVLADGKGSQTVGEAASRLAVDSVHNIVAERLRALERSDSHQVRTILLEGCRAANQAVYDYRTTHANDAGSTILACLRVGDRLTVINVGVSRAYLIRNETMFQVTIDHSEVEPLVSKGDMTPAEARAHLRRTVTHRILGEKPSIEPDYFEFKLQLGDRLLLCSDGLWSVVESSRICETVLTHADPQSACEQLVTLAHEMGGRDDVSVVLVAVVGAALR